MSIQTLLAVRGRNCAQGAASLELSTERQNLPWFSFGHSISNTVQVALGHLSILLAHIQLVVDQHLQSQFNSVQAPQRLHYSLFDVVADLQQNGMKVSDELI